RHARTGASLMAARFERAIQRSAAGALAGGRDGAHLGVRLTGALVKALPDDHALRRNEDGADQRIGTRPSRAAGRMKQRSLHEDGIGGVHPDYHCSSNNPSTYSSAVNDTRSSIASPTPTYRM